MMSHVVKEAMMMNDVGMLVADELITCVYARVFRQLFGSLVKV